MKVKDFMVPAKDCFTVAAYDPIKKVVKKFATTNVGSAIVLDGDEPAGIMTKSEVCKVMLKGLSLDKCVVKKVMTSPVKTINGNLSRDEAAEMIMRKGLHHLVVVDNMGEFLGLISSFDVVRECVLDAQEVFPFMRGQENSSALSAPPRRRKPSSHSSDDSHPDADDTLPQNPSRPPQQEAAFSVVHQESAHHIVFRDHKRRTDEPSPPKAPVQAKKSAVPRSRAGVDTPPLDSLRLSPDDDFKPLLSNVDEKTLSVAEKEVLCMLKAQRVCVKTIKNSEWNAFLARFLTAKPPQAPSNKHGIHDDIGPSRDLAYNSFVTSTSLLPEDGLKMRAYGNPREYTVGVVFALPSAYKGTTECKAVADSETWAWPSGYAAKTEFNVSGGRLINGRQEALVSFETLRKNNHDYVHKKDFEILGRMIEGGLKTVPYNEVFLRVGGYGRIENGRDVTTHEKCSDGDGTGRSLTRGVGLPVAIFVRTATYGHLISLLRTRARICRMWGHTMMEGVPLLLISPVIGTRVLTTSMQNELLHIAAKQLNPFQNSNVSRPMNSVSSSESGQPPWPLRQKLEELLDLGANSIQLTPEERARIAGGFGATDESIVRLLMEAKFLDDRSHSSHEIRAGKGKKGKEKHSISAEDDHEHHLQDVVNEGLEAAVRSGDYLTAKQLLLLYSLVAPKNNESEAAASMNTASPEPKADVSVPPPLDTDRLMSATNSDGLLAVLGSAEVLKAIQSGDAKARALESVVALEDWIKQAENSITFRLSSWKDQQSAQSHLKIAMPSDPSVFAFITSKAVNNRKAFVDALRKAADQAQHHRVEFLMMIMRIVSKMHKPCLRLELLQYILGLDSRFSVSHITRSIELTLTCLNMRTSSAESHATG